MALLTSQQIEKRLSAQDAAIAALKAEVERLTNGYVANAGRVVEPEREPEPDTEDAPRKRSRKR